jgi:hypothetical protein
MAITQPRAQKGGEIGLNGLHYPGGSFLPSADNQKLPKRKRGKGTGNREIAPYQWAVPPDGFESIYHRLLTFVDSNMQIIESAVEYYQGNVEAIEAYIKLWHSGHRFIAESEPYQPIETPDGEYILA